METVGMCMAALKCSRAESGNAGIVVAFIPGIGFEKRHVCISTRHINRKINRKKNLNNFLSIEADLVYHP
jgi:hypothetical protein